MQKTRAEGCVRGGLCTKVIGRHRQWSRDDGAICDGVIEEIGMRVLIVEDDAALGLFLQKGLKLEGHEVAWVGDGIAALEQVEALQPDLMVLDLSLPRKDGTEVLEEMRGKYDDMAVLVLTGRDRKSTRLNSSH